MRIAVIAILAFTLLAEIKGVDTIGGCYMRGFMGIEDGRCGTTAKVGGLVDG